MNRRSFLRWLGIAPAAVVATDHEFTYMLPEYYHQGWVQGSHTVYDREKVLHHCNDYKRCTWLYEHPGRIIKATQEGEP